VKRGEERLDRVLEYRDGVTDLPGGADLVDRGYPKTTLGAASKILREKRILEMKTEVNSRKKRAYRQM